MRRVELDADEIASGDLTSEHLAACLAALEEDGCVLLPGIVAVEHIDVLCDKMLEDIRTLEADGELANNWQGVRPPPCHPWLFGDILFNEAVIAVSHAVLGDGVALDAYGANTAFPGSGEQGVHGDGGQLWPDLPQAHPPFALVVNIPLVDVTEENGATWLWPGTHRDTGTVMRRSEQVDPARLAEWEARHGPGQSMTTRRGDVVLRDNRMWHAGRPNRTGRPRPMLTMIHVAPWWFRGGVEFEEGTREFLEQHPTLAVNAVFVEAPAAYLHQGHSRPLRAIVPVGGPRT